MIALSETFPDFASGLIYVMKTNSAVVFFWVRILFIVSIQNIDKKLVYLTAIHATRNKVCLPRKRCYLTKQVLLEEIDLKEIMYF